MDIEVGGQIQGISLGSFLQIVNMDKTTCTLKIYSNDDIGYLYMKDGALVAAETGHLSNVDAAYEILSWNKTVIIIDNAPIPNQNIKIPLMSVLMEGLRRKDEKNAQMGVVEAVEPKELEIEFDPDTYQSKDDQIASQFVMSDKKTPEPPAGPDDSERTEKPLKMADKPPAPPVQPPDLPPSVLPDAGEPFQESGEQAAKADMETAFFEDEDEKPAQQAQPLTARIKRMSMAIILAAAVIFGGLHLYGVFLGKSDYNRIIDQVKAQKDLESMKSVLGTYINTQPDDNRYIADAISKMNDINDLIKIENTINALSLDDQYKDKAMGLYNGFLGERRGTFLEDYVDKKLTDIPKSLEAYEFKKLSVIEKRGRSERMKAYKAFIATYPESKNIQVVQNLIAALADEAFAELNRSSAACARSRRWDTCVRLCDAFLQDFPEDGRAPSVMESRKKMADLHELETMKQRAAAMDYDSAKKMYIDYMATSAESTVKKEIRDQIAALNEKIELQAKWEETLTYCRNSQYDISQRIRELRDYMERDASGMYRREANALMRDLKQEERVGQVRMAEIIREREERDRMAKVQAERDRVLQERERITQNESRRRARDQNLGESARRMARALGEGNGRFRVNTDKTVTDSRTGLTWCLVDSYGSEGNCMDFDEARAFVRNLNTGGYRDWRLPDSGELAMLYNSRPYYPSSGASWYWTLRSSSESWGNSDRAAVFYPDRKDVFEQVFKSKGDCGYVHAVRP
jgi:hypothetical protein